MLTKNTDLCKFGENRFSGLDARAGYGHTTDILKIIFSSLSIPKRISLLLPKTQNRYCVRLLLLSL